MTQRAPGLRGYLVIVPVLSMLGATAPGAVLSPLDQYPGSSLAIALLILCGMLISTYAAIRVQNGAGYPSRLDSYAFGFGCYR
jgi:hypothetical protein